MADRLGSLSRVLEPRDGMQTGVPPGCMPSAGGGHLPLPGPASPAPAPWAHAMYASLRLYFRAR